MDKILEALKKLLPADQLNEVASAVKEMLAEAKAELEGEFNEKLEEAYTELSSELATNDKTGEAGYAEAYGIINDLRNRLELQREEFEQTLEEGYEEAYQMLKNEQAKTENATVELYDEYDQKLNEMKEYVVDKLDQFLQSKGAEIYEQARRDILNDPRMAEHKVVLDRIVDLTANYLSDEGIAAASCGKLEEARRQIEKLQTEKKLMEARQVKLSLENTKLNEAYRHASDLITESRSGEKKERATKGKQVSGRGHGQMEETVVIAEHNNVKQNSKAAVDDDDVDLLENIGLDRATSDMLAGITKV